MPLVKIAVVLWLLLTIANLFIILKILLFIFIL